MKTGTILSSSFCVLRSEFISFIAPPPYSLTLVIANITAVNGLPALPFLSFGFLLANADLLWRRFRPAR